MMKFLKSMFTRGGGEKDKDDDGLIELQTVKGLFDPLDRLLTDEEKNCPMTFFGVPYEVRKERIEQAAAHEAAKAVDWSARAAELRAGDTATGSDHPEQRPDGPRMKQ